MSSNIRAIQGMSFSKDLKYMIMVWTQTQPIRGIRHWKMENMPAILHILFFFIFVSFRPFARETEKASMARPAPRKMLFKKNIRFQSNSPDLPYTGKT